MSKRPARAGSVTRLAADRFWARGPKDLTTGKRPSFGIWPTEREAEDVLGAAGKALQSGAVSLDPKRTLRTFGSKVLDRREKDDVRGVDRERSVFDTHIATAHFAAYPLERVDSPDVARWLREMGQKKALQGRRGGAVETNRRIARSSVKRAFAILSAIFDEALELGLVKRNPCAGLRSKRRAGAEKTKAAEVFLTREEQLAIRDTPADVTDLERDFILFAFGCGVRRGEQFNLELEDVHVDGAHPHAVVRFGSDGKPVKNDRILEVPLFGFALEATRRQMKRLEGQPNPLGLLWPTELGNRRRGKPLGNGHFRTATKGATHLYIGDAKAPVRAKRGQVATHRYVDRFSEVLALVGITRRVRWHDLRHTCASALLQGQWGEEWTIQEVCAQLNHSSIAVTERYAHLGETVLKRASKKVTIGPRVGYALVTGAPEGDPGVAAVHPIDPILSEICGSVEQRGIEPLTSALRTRSILELLRGLQTENGPHNQLVTNLAATLAALLEKTS